MAGRMVKLLREHGLAFTMFGIFAATLIGLSFVGWDTYNQEQADHGEATVGFVAYLGTPNFGEAVFENWESEFLQMAAYVVLTIWLVEKGSSESKPPEGDPELDADPRSARRDPNAPGPVRRGGWQLSLYENSLGIVFAMLFLLSIALHALGGASEYNANRKAHGERPVSVGTFVTTSTFWFQSFQNWQSEFLAVGSLVTLSVYLRQRGSPESKPAAAPHDRTGS